MGGRETCKDCSKWEEKMYWTQNQIMQFFVSLVGDFADQLAIPKKFAKHLKDKLPEAVTLKDAIGFTWNVGLLSDGENLFFKNGWKEFVNNHSLEEKDMLVFKYYGDSRFDVVVFDQRSSCEKESSCFVAKCGHKKLEAGEQMTGKARDSSVVAIHTTTDDGVGSGHKKVDVECQTAEKSWDGSLELFDSGLDDRIASILSEKPRIEESVTPLSCGQHNAARSNRKIQKVAYSFKSVTPRRTIRKKQPSTSQVKEKVIIDAEQNSIGSGRKDPQYASNRRPITESEKQKALQLAQAAVTNGDSFMVAMQPSHVYKRFYVSIPAEWAHNHLSPKHHIVILRYKETAWSVKLIYRKDLCTLGFSGGWKKFALENNIEEFDVCRFELASPPGTSIVMNVRIFRVVEDLKPVTRIK